MKAFDKWWAEGTWDLFSSYEDTRRSWRAALEWTLEQAGWEREDITEAIEQELEEIQ